MKHILAAALGADAVTMEIDDDSPEFVLRDADGQILQDRVHKFSLKEERHEVEIITPHFQITLGGLTAGGVQTLKTVWARWEARS